MGVTLRMTRAKAVMLSRGLTCVELADRAFVGRAYLCTLLNGRSRPGRAAAEAVAGALGWDGEPMALFEEIELREG